MAGPLMGILNQAGGAMFGSQVGQALGGLAGEVLTASDIGLPLGPAGKAALVPLNVHRVRRRPRRRVRRTSCSTWRCGRPPTSGCSGTSPGSGAPARRRRGLRPRHHDRRVQDRGVDARHRPDEPGRRCRRPWRVACSSRRRPPPSRPRSTRLETTLALVEGWVDEIVGQATEDRMPAAGRAAGGGPPPSRGGRPGRVDVRRPGRPGAAPATAARRLHAVGVAALPAGHQGRDAVWSHPDLLPDRGRPRRPAGLPRGAEPSRRRSPTPSSTPRSPTCSTARPSRVAPTTRPTVPTRPTRATPARRRARPTATNPGREPAARRRPGGAARLGRAHGRPGARCGSGTSTTSSGTPTALSRSCFPDHLTAGALMLSADRRPGAAHPARQGPPLVPLRRAPRAGRPHPGRGGAPRGARGVRGRRPRARPGAGAARRARGAVLRRRAGAVRHLDVRFVAVAPPEAEHAVSEESLDVRWWPVDALPPLDEDMPALVGLARDRLFRAAR